MSRTNVGHRQFYYDTPCFGFVTKVYPLDSDRRLYVDCIPLDKRGVHIKAQVLIPPGFAANCKKNMTVQIHYVNGSSQAPVVTLHGFNSDPITVNPMNTPNNYADPMPSMFENMDDVLMYHQSSSAYIRAYGLLSSPTVEQSQGGPGGINIGLQSGAHIIALDYEPAVTNPPTKPTRASVSIEMPQGALLELDEPAAGESTFTYTHPTGATLTCDANGTWTILSAPQSSSSVESTSSFPTDAYSTTISAIEQQIKTKTGSGFYTLYDDAGRAISHVTPGGLQTISSDATSEISHIAPNIGLGALVGSLDSTHAALNQSHLTTFESNMYVKRLDDLVKFAAAMIAAGVPNAGAVIAQLATLIHIPVPNGSAVVKLVS